MNKIYKVVWSKVKNCYVVVSEMAKNIITGGVKSAKIGSAPMAKGLALGAAFAFVVTGSAMAADLDGKSVVYEGAATANKLVNGATAQIVGTGVETVTFKNDQEKAVNGAMGGYAGKASITNVDKIVVNGKYSNVFTISDAASVGDYYVNLTGIGSIEATDDGKKSQFFHGFAGDITVEAGDITLNNVGSAALAQVGNQKWHKDPAKQINHGSQIKIDVENNFNITTSQASSVIAAGNYNRVANDGNNPSVEITAGNMNIDAKNSTAFETYGGTWSVDEGGNVADGTFTGVANIDVNVEGALNVEAANVIQAGNGTQKGDSSVNINAGTINFVASDYVVDAYHNAAVNVVADTAVISGDISAQGNSVVNIGLGKNGSFTGNVNTDETSATTLNLGNGSAWNMTADSTVTKLEGLGYEVKGDGDLTVNSTLAAVGDEQNLKDNNVTPQTNKVSVDNLTVNSTGMALNAKGGHLVVEANTVTLNSQDGGIYVDAYQNGKGITVEEGAGSVTVDVSDKLTINAVGNGVSLGSTGPSKNINITGTADVEINAGGNGVYTRGSNINADGYKPNAINIFGSTVTVTSTGADDGATRADKGHAVFAKGSSINISATEKIELTAEMEGKNAIYATAASEDNQGSVTIGSAKGYAADVIVNGNIAAENKASVTVDFATANSKLNGNVITGSDANTTLSLTNGATWTTDDKSTVTNLNVEDAEIIIKNTQEKSITVGTLTGTSMNVDVDKVVEGAVVVEDEKDDVRISVSTSNAKIDASGAANYGSIVKNANGEGIVDEVNANNTFISGDVKFEADGEGGFKVVETTLHGDIKVNGDLTADNLYTKDEIDEYRKEVSQNMEDKFAAAQQQVADKFAEVEADYKAADAELQANIDREAQIRGEADNKLQANIDAEAQARQEADNKLQANIDAEAQARQDADNRLQANIDANSANIANNASNIEANKQAIDAEKAAREEADAVLSDAIENVAGDIADTKAQVEENKVAIEQNAQDIANEVAARQESDNKLQANIDKESADRQIADAQERAERAQADQELQANIDAEAQARQDADAAEAQARSEEDQRIENKFDGEVNNLNNRIDKVDAKIDKVGAMAAAMASLKTMGYDPEAPTEIAVGIGQYRNETGIAIGAFHYPNKDFMLNFSLSTAGDEVMGGIGATWKIGRKKPAGETVEDKVAKAEAMKEAAKAARVKAQQARHAKMLAEK